MSMTLPISSRHDAEEDVLVASLSSRPVNRDPGLARW